VSDVCLNPLVLLDSRRLTGANLYWELPCAIIEVQLANEWRDVVRLWREGVTRLLVACDITGQETCERVHDGWAALLVSAPIDALYAMCELNEVAWAMAIYETGFGTATDFEVETRRLRELFAAERNPALLELQQAAADHHVPFLCDDDEVSVGYGYSCQCWPRAALPRPDQVHWSAAHDIPLALVTGTNGKSTTVRMLATIMRAGGLRGGLTSTDFIRVDAETIAEGDYSGNGGARLLLRHPGVEAAVLEVARGGLLRRGLAVHRADAALISNIAADHLGEYGIDTLEQLAEAKFIVHRALDESSPLVLNADDAELRKQERRLRETTEGTTWWFSLLSNNPLVQPPGVACWLQEGALWTNASLAPTMALPRRLCGIQDITASHGGLLKHNVLNAMGAALLAIALGMSDQAIREGLREFRGDEQDNPGRGNWFEHRGIHIVVDFAHNEHGLRALGETVAALSAKRVIVMLGQAGDRSDQAIRNMARAAIAMQPQRMLLYELPGYERGRPLGEPPALIRDEALQNGMEAGRLVMHADPLSAARDALAQAEPGDALVLLALIQRREILQAVHDFMRGGRN